MSEEKRGLQCLNCGQLFEPTCHITRRKFCCAACRHKYNNAKRRYDVPIDICPGCGDIVEQSGKRGRRRRFCSAPCRNEWWTAYHKANPSTEEAAEACATCGAELQGKQKGQKYCSRFCYLLAMEQTHVEGGCRWCGRPIATTVGTERAYCSRECAAAGRYALRRFRKGSHRISAAETQLWLEKLAETAMASKSGTRGKRVRLVCGTTSMYTGLDGLMAIIRYHLRCDPCDGSVYVFRDATGNMLKYIEWDGQSFQRGKRRAQSGTYPGPKERLVVWSRSVRKSLSIF